MHCWVEFLVLYNRCSLITYFIDLGVVKKFEFFHKMLQKNPKEPFGRPHNVNSSVRTWPSNSSHLPFPTSHRTFALFVCDSISALPVS